MQSKMTISLVLQNIHYNLLNECNSVYWPFHHNRIPPQFFLFSGFFHLCRTLVFCVGKKTVVYATEVTLETSSQAFLKPIPITNGVEVTSLLIRLFLLLHFVPAFSISVWIVRQRFNV